MNKSTGKNKAHSKPRALADDETKLWEEVRKRTTKLQGVTPRAMRFDAIFDGLDTKSCL